MNQAHRVWTVASMAEVATAQRAVAASLRPGSSGFGGWRGWVKVVLGALSPWSVDSELLAGPAEEGWVSPLHRAKALPGPCWCRQRRHLVMPNSLLRALLWCPCVPIGVPLKDQLHCLCRWSLDPLGGALALVSSGFLPLGQNAFRQSCAGGVFHACEFDRCTNSFLS
jgi:hypothetical protein